MSTEWHADTDGCLDDSRCVFRWRCTGDDTIVCLHAADVHKFHRIWLGRMSTGWHADADGDGYSCGVYWWKSAGVDTELYLYRWKYDLHEFQYI